MPDEYFIATNGESKGPYSLSQLKSMWDRGLLTSNTQYWSAGMDDWYIISNLLDAPHHVPATVQPSVAGSETAKQIRTLPEAAIPRSPNKGNMLTPSVAATRSHNGSNIVVLAIVIIIVVSGWYFVAPAGLIQNGFSRFSASFNRTAETSHGNVITASPPANSEATVDCDRGVALVNKGEYEEGIAYFSKAIEIDPTVPRFYSQRAYAYYINGQFDRLSNPDSKALDHALADYSKVIELTPKSAEAYFNRGVVYGLKAQFAFAVNQPIDLLRHAQEDYKQALIIDPELKTARANLENVRNRLAEAGAVVEQDNTGGEKASDSKGSQLGNLTTHIYQTITGVGKETWSHGELIQYLKAQGLSFTAKETDLGSFYGPAMYFYFDEDKVYVQIRKTSQEAKDLASPKGQNALAWGRFYLEGKPDRLAHINSTLP